MSPEARRSSGGDAHPGRDALLGALAAIPFAAVLTQITESGYRTGAVAVAVLAVLGLATRWALTAGAAPVVILGFLGQILNVKGDVSGNDIAGILVLTASVVAVVLALHRWEGDRRQALEEAQARQRNERRLLALVNLARDLASAEGRAGLLEIVRARLAPAAGGRWLALVVNDGDQFDCPVTTAMGAAGVTEEIAARLTEPTSPAIHAARRGEAMYFATPGELTARYTTFAEYLDGRLHPAVSILPVPGLGALMITWAEPQVFSAAQRAFLETVTNLVGAAAERIGSVERGEIERFDRAFHAMLDSVGLYRAVLDDAGTIVDFEIDSLNPASTAIGFAPPELVGRRVRELWPSTPLVWWMSEVLERGTPLILEDVDLASLGPVTDHVSSVSVRATRLDAERVVLVVRDTTERVQLARALEASNRVFEAAQELAHVGSWRYDIATDEVEWSDELRRICGADVDGPVPRPNGASILGFEHPDDTGTVRRAITAAAAELTPFSFDVRIRRFDTGQIRHLATTGHVITGPDEAVVGLLGASQDITERVRTEDARLAALADAKQQRAVVNELQRVLLPTELPARDHVRVFAHYRAASLVEAVGGDWYDAFELPDGRIGMLVGDVAGHGVGCAALANELRLLVRVRMRDGLDPAEVLARLDADLGDELVTCILATFDLTTNVATIANAGHPPAVLSRSDGDALVGARTRPPLGVGPVRASDQQRISLRTGDLLVLYTDGLIERRGHSIDAGIERLRAAVPIARRQANPAVAIADALGGDTTDDLCVLTLSII